MRWRVILLASALALVGCKPKLPSDALSDVDGLSGGGDLTCAHRRDATTWCWGDNALNEHWGNEHAQSVALAGIVAAAVGSQQTCVILADRTVACREESFGLFDKTWETSAALQIEPPSYAMGGRSLSVVRGLTDVAQLGLGTYIDCARKNDGTVACWGDYAEVLRTGAYDLKRRSGAPVPGSSEVTTVKGLPPIVDLAGSQDSGIAIGKDGSAWILGGLDRGVVRVPGIDDAVQAAGGNYFACVRRRSGEVACWRTGAAIEPLDAVPTKPTLVPGVAHAQVIAAGQYQVCALVEDAEGARAVCWGSHDLMSGAKTSDWLAPRTIPNAGHLRALMVGRFHACGLRDDGRVLCWGDARRLGNGYEESSGPSPHEMGFVRTGAADDPTGTTRRNALLVLALSIVGLVLALLVARRVDRVATNAWRLLPGVPVVAGTGYRAGELPAKRLHAPKLVRSGAYLGLASVGADMAFLAMFGFYALVAGGLGWHQLAHNATMGMINLLIAGLVFPVLGWMVFVARTLISGARTSKPALARWRTIGVFGTIGHALLGLMTLAGQRDLGIVLDHHSITRSPAATMPALVALLLASALGVLASLVVMVASRHHRELP